MPNGASCGSSPARVHLEGRRRQYVHERLRSARHSLNALVEDGTMFTFVEMTEEREGRWGSTNNAIEGEAIMSPTLV